MREILFKAKRIDNGEWVVGQYVNTCWAKKISRYWKHFRQSRIITGGIK